MGLDMYLSASKYTFKYLNEELKNSLDGLDVGQGPIKLNRIGGEAMYWRKANAIHNWFVQKCAGGVDECQRVDVAPAQLIELRDLCAVLLAERRLDEDAARTRALQVLPPKTGFFFGSSEVDDWYWRDLTDTRDGLTSLIDMPGFYDWEFSYQASW